MFDPNRQWIVQIDVEPRNASWIVPTEVALVGDAARTLELLHRRLAGRLDASAVSQRRKSFAAFKVARDYFTHPMQASDNVPMASQRLVSEIARAAPEGAVICSDAGNNRHWMNRFFQTKRANCYYGTGGLGGVSWSLPAVLCAKFLDAERPAIGVSSDGGFAMQMHVILTAVQHRLNPVHVVMNNSRPGMTSESMGNRAVGNKFPDTDYAVIACSMGAWGERVGNPGAVGARVVRHALAVTFQPAEAAVGGALFTRIPAAIQRLL